MFFFYSISNFCFTEFQIQRKRFNAKVHRRKSIISNSLFHNLLYFIFISVSFSFAFLIHLISNSAFSTMRRAVESNHSPNGPKQLSRLPLSPSRFTLPIFNTYIPLSRTTLQGASLTSHSLIIDLWLPTITSSSCYP